MLELSGLLVAMVLGVAEAGRRDLFFQSPISTRGGADMIMYFGWPPRMYYACLNTRSAHFIVMDAACGHSRAQVSCPHYCHDERLRRILCSPACEDLTPAVHLARCGFREGYNTSQSATFVDVGEDVTAMFHNSWPFYGRRGIERMAMELARSDRTAPKKGTKKPTLAFEDVPFVRGFSFDKKYLHGRKAMMGMAPESPFGRPAFLSDLRQRGVVTRNQISVKHNVPPPYLTSAVPLASMVVGALDRFSCRDWKLFPAYDRLGWVFEIDDVVFLGERMAGRQFGRVALEYERIGIPDSVVEKFIAEGLFFELNVTRLILFKGNFSLLELEFRVGEHQVVLPNEWIRDMSFVRDAESRYTDGSQWSFGVALLRHLCFGFDYDVGAVAWAERRRIPLK